MLTVGPRYARMSLMSQAFSLTFLQSWGINAVRRPGTGHPVCGPDGSSSGPQAPPSSWGSHPPWQGPAWASPYRRVGQLLAGGIFVSMGLAAFRERR